jgi:hypothetical protein
MSNQGVGSAKSFSANGRPSPGCREAAEVVLDGGNGVAQDASSLGLAPPARSLVDRDDRGNASRFGRSRSIHATPGRPREATGSLSSSG